MTVVALSCQEIKCYSNLPLLGIKEKSLLFEDFTFPHALKHHLVNSHIDVYLDFDEECI